MVTFEDIRNNAEIRTYIEKGNENLGVLGFKMNEKIHFSDNKFQKPSKKVRKRY